MKVSEGRPLKSVRRHKSQRGATSPKPQAHLAMGVVSIGKKQEPKKNGTMKGTIEGNTAEASPSPAARGCFFGPPQRRNDAE